MDPPFEPPSQSNREHHHNNRYVSINSHDHPRPIPHPRPQRPIPHPQGPFISPPSSPYHPSHPPINLPFPPDARRPLRSPIVQHPPNRIPANHLIPFPIPQDRGHAPDAALTAPRLLWDEAQRLVRRRSPIPIGWEGHGPLFPEPDPRRHHQGLPLEIINSDHVSRKRYNSDTDRYEFVRDDRFCGEIPWNESDHHHHLHQHQHQDQRHDHRHIRRRNNPPLESFSPDSFPSTSAAAAPDHRSVEWTARNRIPFDVTDPSHCIATERAERVMRPFDDPGHPDAGSAERAARVRYPPDGPIAPDLSSSEKDAHGRHPCNGPKPLNHSPGEKGARLRHPRDGLNLLDHSPGEKAIRNRLSLDAPYPFDHSLGEKATRIRQPFDGPKHNDLTPGEKVAGLKYPLNGPKPQDHSPFERTARTRYSNPGSFERDGRIRYPSHGTSPPNLSSIDREKQIIHPFDGPKLPDHGFSGRNPRNRHLLDAPKLLQQRIERGNYTEDDQLWIQQTPQETDKKVINGNDDVLRTVSRKRLPLYARLGNGKKMGVHEKSQKPSVLLRIQSGSKPIRKRRDELLLASAYAASSSMANPKGKVPLSSSEHVSEKDSSVELDVSFKSNALVAKPILPTPSQTVNNTNKVPVKKKKKTVKVVKRAVSKSLSRLAGKKIGKSSALSSCRNDLQHSEIVEEGPLWSMAVGNGGADAQSSSPQKEMQKIEILEEVKPSNAGATTYADLDPCPSPDVVLIDDSSAEESPEVAALLEEESKNGHAMHEDNEMKYMHPNLGSTPFVKDLIIVDSRSPSPSGFGVDLQDAIPAGVLTEIHVGALQDGVKEKEKEREDQKEVGLLVECGTTGNGDCEDTEEVSSMGKESGILPLEVQTLVFDQRSPSGAIYVDGSNLMRGLESHQSDCKQPGEDVLAGSTLDSNEDGAAHSPDRVSVMHSLEPLPVVPEGIFLNAVQSLCQPSDENSCMDNKNRLDEKASSEDGLPLEAHDACILEPEVDKELDKSSQINDQLVHEKPPPLPLQGTTKPTADLSLTASEFIGKRTHQRSGIPRSFRHSAGFASGSLKGKSSSASILRPRTWRRSDSSPSPIRELSLSHSALRRVSPKKSGRAQNMSYIRKGNSLVRNAAAVTSLLEASAGLNNPVNVSNTSGGDKITNCFGSDRKVESTSYSKTGGTNPSIVRPQTPPLPQTAKLPNCNINHTQESPCLTMTGPLSQAGSETSMHESLDPNKPEQGKDASGSVKGFENQAINLRLDGVENQCAIGVGTLRSSKTKRLIYVKRKSNQLVAASRPETHDSSLSATKTPEVFPFSTSSDFYYKKKRNQLVRNSALLKHQSKQAVAVFDDNSNSEGQGAAKISSLKFGEGLIKRRFDKVLKKTCKPSRLSLVWTLGGTQSHKRDVTSLQRPKVLPYLVPWKRTMYWRCFINSIMPTSNKSSSSLIRKLRLLRKRDTVYTRSISGFSLRKSRVLSVGGTNLKWSKSIERRSKKANEEATLAVAAVEKEKREQKGAELIVRNGKNGSRSSRKSFHGIELLPGKAITKLDVAKQILDVSFGLIVVFRKKHEPLSYASCTPLSNIWKLTSFSTFLSVGFDGLIKHLHTGERIFRIGSIRYKMDSSKRTLLRIPDEKSSCSVDLKSGKNSTISFVPRRLAIGNDEYIRIGNGNQLVRDPKRLTRILASEKVRWSLHTARLRLARKKQYCQFFTRFGKCNKDSGKCQYIHDPAKVAVCTKFLKGSCSDTNCRLTHKIIPERMQDCSYFLQGLCTNESCPYRHVNVNPDAPVCDGFLRGYCADGNECRRKHSYNCPMFEATGMCPQGSACKLHHPKSGNKSRKRKRPKNQTNARGRYFLFPGLTDAGHFGTVTPDDGIATQCGDIFFCEGQYADYISLDAGDEEASKIDNPIGTNTSLCGGESSGIWSENLDALIKPVRLMNMNAS